MFLRKKEGGRPEIEVFRLERHENPCCQDDKHRFALVTDAGIEAAVSRFGFDEIDRLTDLIEERLLRPA